MDALTYLDELEKRNIKVVSIPWVREKILAERTNHTSDRTEGAYSHFQTLDEHLQVRDLGRSQRVSRGLQRDPLIEQQIKEYKLTRTRR